MFYLLEFVKSAHETGDIYTFYFKKPKTSHRAGQHALFILPGWYRPHPFSISSAPEEEFLAFTTHVDTGSRFKRKLKSMQPGATMIMIGPVLRFVLRAGNRSHVLLAQGIGITPFRSMMVSAGMRSIGAKIALIHVDSHEHAFQATTRQHASMAAYPASKVEFSQLLEKQSADQAFYISGSPVFVRETRTSLKKLGVAKRDIKTDSFLGY